MNHIRRDGRSRAIARVVGREARRKLAREAAEALIKPILFFAFAALVGLALKLGYVTSAL